MVLPFDLSHLDPTIVQLLFESLTEHEIMPELGIYDLAAIRTHVIALIESGYVQGELSATSQMERTAHPRCLTIKGYTLLSHMHAEQGSTRRRVSPQLCGSAARRWAA